MRLTSDHQSAQQAAVEQLFSVHGDELLRLALLLSGNRQLAEDLVRRHSPGCGSAGTTCVTPTRASATCA